MTAPPCQNIQIYYVEYNYKKNRSVKLVPIEDIWSLWDKLHQDELQDWLEYEGGFLHVLLSEKFMFHCA